MAQGWGLQRLNKQHPLAELIFLPCASDCIGISQQRRTPTDGNSLTQAQVNYSEPSISLWLEQAAAAALVMAAEPLKAHRLAESALGQRQTFGPT
jgi:hypothetical protein